MVSSGSKRVVVIKDIPSNFIEEAIFILKSNDGKSEIVKQTSNNNEQKVDNLQNKFHNNDFIMKEAQIIIDNFIKENKLQAEKRRIQYEKKNIISKVFSVNIIINAALVASIILLFLLAFKAF